MLADKALVKYAAADAWATLLVYTWYKQGLPPADWSPLVNVSSEATSLTHETDWSPLINASSDATSLACENTSLSTTSLTHNPVASDKRQQNTKKQTQTRQYQSMPAGELSSDDDDFGKSMFTGPGPDQGSRI